MFYGKKIEKFENRKKIGKVRNFPDVARWPHRQMPTSHQRNCAPGVPGTPASANASPGSGLIGNCRLPTSAKILIF